MLMFGNLIKEIGSDTSRLFDAAANSIMNAATIFLGLSVGATMTSEAFLNWTTIGIVDWWFPGICIVHYGRYFLCEAVQPIQQEEDQSADWCYRPECRTHGKAVSAMK